MADPSHAREAVVGVIGGMGPEATVELMRRVIAATPAADDADHIRMLVDNNPKVPSRIEALLGGTGEDPGPILAGMARGLEAAGADFLVIPCNTAHHYWRDVHEAVDIPVWDLIELTLAHAAARLGSPMRMGMLASPAVRRVGLYERYGARHGAQFLYSSSESGLLGVIRAVKAGDINEHHLAAFNGAARELSAAGADALVLACTEFSLIGEPLQVDIPIIDTVQVLADAIVAYVKA